MKGLMFLLWMICSTAVLAQQPLVAENNFHQGSNQFINGNPDQALASVKEGLKADPGNAKLQALRKILEEEKKKQDQQKKEQEKKEKQEKQQQQKDQQNKEKNEKDKKEQEQKEKEQKENKDDKNKDDKEKEDAEKKEQEKKDQEQKDKENPDDKDKKEENKELPPDVQQRLKDMKISEEKARMILEAMKNQEVQYLQQNKRQATKPKDRGKPDW